MSLVVLFFVKDGGDMPNNELKILITGQLNENITEKTIQEQLNKIQSKLNLTIGIDAQQISQIANQVKQLQSQFEKQSKGIKIIDDENVISSINQIKKGMPEIYTSIDKALEKYKQFGQVKIEKSFDPVTRELNGFTLQLQNAQGVIEKIKFDLVQLKMPDNTQNVFQVTNRKSIDDTEKIREKQLQLEQKINTQVQKQNEKLQHQLEIFKRQAEINVKNLQRRYGDAVDTNALNNYLASVRSLSTSTPDVKRKMDELNMTFKEISANVKSSSSHVLSFGEALQTAFIKFPVWLISGTVIVQSVNFFQQGIEYVNELNKALTEIAIVTGQTQQQVAKLGEEYNKLAYQMGVTTTDVAKASVEFMRQGMSQEEAMKRVQIATEYAKISSLDFNKAVEILTATTNSMNVDIQRAADVFSYLGDATATGADEIGEAFQKVGGSAGALNLNFEKVASWIAVLSSRTRESASTIGKHVAA